jgi:uncharacterized protein (DUF1778 family)
VIGRPKGSVRSFRGGTLNIRASAQQRSAWAARAALYAHSVAGWVRWACLIETGQLADYDTAPMAGDEPDEPDGNVNIRLTAEERKAWRRAATVQGLTLSDWIRRVCDRRVGLADE